MRSNELRDDGASLTTLEDLAPIFYGSAFDMGWAALRDLSLVSVAAVQPLRDLISDLSLGHWQLSAAPRREIRLGFLPRSELRLSRLQFSSQTVVIHASDGTQRCEGVERLRGLAPL